MSMDVTGLDAIFANMDRQYEELEVKADQAIQTGGIVCEGETKKNCPVKTGRLRSSYQYKKIDKMECAVGTTVKYAPPVELGTYKMAARPHLFIGFLAGAKSIEEDLKANGV